MSFDPLPGDAGPSASSASPEIAGSTGAFNHAAEVWWPLASQLVVVIVLAVILLV